MTRYMLFLLIVVASTATALAAIAPDRSLVSDRGQNVTVIEKNQAFPVVGPVIVEQCRLEDCSDATGWSRSFPLGGPHPLQIAAPTGRLRSDRSLTFLNLNRR